MEQVTTSKLPSENGFLFFMASTLPAPESRHTLHSLYLCLFIHSFQPLFQALRRFIGRCKESLWCVYFINQKICPFIFTLHIKTAAENPSRLQDTENLTVSRLLIGKSMETVQ